MAVRWIAGISLCVAMLIPDGAAAFDRPVSAEDDRQTAGHEMSADNAELAEMFEQDQAARRSGTTDWQALAKEDAQRRQQVRSMLDEGVIRTANDYYAAAFIFQHGDKPDDFLLAHALAMTALDGGHDKAGWIAAASLDRYLQNIGRAQIYGTQSIYTSETGLTQGDYNQVLIPDPMREAAGVASVAEQEAKRAAQEAMIKEMAERAKKMAAENKQ